MIKNKGMSNMNENPNTNENQTQTTETVASVENQGVTTPVAPQNGENKEVQPVATTPKVDDDLEVLQPVDAVKEVQAPEVASTNTPSTLNAPTTPTGEPVALQTSATPASQASSSVSNVAGVNPILKETSKVSFGTKKTEEEPANKSAEYSPMEEKKENKKTRSKIPLIIFFILLFAFVFFLPNINDYFKEQEGKKKIDAFDRELREEEERQKKEEEEARKEQEKKEQEEQQYKTLTCVSAPVTDVNTTTVTTREFTYSGDKLKNAKVSTNVQYLVVDDTYTAKKTACENKTIAAATLTGYEFSCSVAELEIEESNNFDLKEFKTQKLTNSDGTEETIETEYKYDGSVKEIQTALTAQGYTCQ